jgi:hypothetical protein
MDFCVREEDSLTISLCRTRIRGSKLLFLWKDSGVNNGAEFESWSLPTVYDDHPKLQCTCFPHKWDICGWPDPRPLIQSVAFPSECQGLLGCVRLLPSSSPSQNQHPKGKDRKGQGGELNPEPVPVNSRPFPFLFTSLTLAGLVTLYYGWWNLQLGPEDWRGNVAAVLGALMLGYGFVKVLSYFRPH